MGRIRVRLIGSPSDVQAFADFINKVEATISALSIISPGENRPARNSTDVLRYMEVEFDSSAMQGE